MNTKVRTIILPLGIEGQDSWNIWASVPGARWMWGETFAAYSGYYRVGVVPSHVSQGRIDKFPSKNDTSPRAE